jgi:hypothetical protein
MKFLILTVVLFFFEFHSHIDRDKWSNEQDKYHDVVQKCGFSVNPIDQFHGVFVNDSIALESRRIVSSNCNLLAVNSVIISEPREFDDFVDAHTNCELDEFHDVNMEDESLLILRVYSAPLSKVNYSVVKLNNEVLVLFDLIEQYNKKLEISSLSVVVPKQKNIKSYKAICRFFKKGFTGSEKVKYIDTREFTYKDMSDEK